MLLRHYFVDGQFLGTGPAPYDLLAGQPLSLTLVCPCCGEQWARLPVAEQLWIPYRAVCRKCKPLWETFCPSGSLLQMSWIPELLDLLPEAVVQRELRLWLSYKGLQ